VKDWSTVIVAVIAIIGAAIGAALSSWLGGRQAVSQDLREHQLTSYPAVWERTSVVSRWPRTTAGITNLEALHGDLRTWYYTFGGLYLSGNARARYGHLQELIERIVGRGDTGSAGSTRTALTGVDYDDVMGAASAFRSALTEDIQSRRQRSLLAAVARGVAHRREDGRAELRLSRHPPGRVPAERIELRPDDEQLRPPPTATAS
jgi:hypothetical protein